MLMMLTLICLINSENNRFFYMCRRVILAWNAIVVEELTRKQTVADDMHCYILVKRCFADWKKV